jgi:hypothetical protein
MLEEGVMDGTCQYEASKKVDLFVIWRRKPKSTGQACVKY